MQCREKILLNDSKHKNIRGLEREREEKVVKTWNKISNRLNGQNANFAQEVYKSNGTITQSQRQSISQMAFAVFNKK